MTSITLFSVFLWWVETFAINPIVAVNGYPRETNGIVSKDVSFHFGSKFGSSWMTKNVHIVYSRPEDDIRLTLRDLAN